MCDKGFQTRESLKVFCSSECKLSRKRAPRNERKCPCGNTFSAAGKSNKTYCSVECYRTAQSVMASAKISGREPRRLACPQCGDSFLSKAHNAKFCSKLCSQRHTRGYPSTRTCKTCGSQFGFRRGSLCSDECRSLAREESVKRYSDKAETRAVASLRRRLKNAINYKGKGSLSGLTRELIGCTPKHLREHLESQFKPGMTWGNYGLFGWHIDHIRPCASFDLTDPEQQKACFNYKNLQPLWAEENLKKSSKMPDQEKCLV